MSEVAARSWWGRALMLVGLTAIAVQQPVLDLMGRNPEFFVAGSYTASQIAMFALVVTVVPPLVVVTTYTAVRWLHRPTGEVLHLVLVAALGFVVGNVAVRAAGAGGWWPAVGAGVGGAALALLLRRSVAGGLLLQYLAGAPLLFLAAFLLASPAGGLVTDDVDDSALGAVHVPRPPGPVVVIVLDELPLPTLLTSDGRINEERYPAFARLAASSTWFRNTSSLHAQTELAVPSLATGTVVEDGTLPIQNDLPRNLLALLSTAMPVHRHEPVTDLCPHNACERRDGQPLRQALEDAAIVYGHRVLPPSWRRDLPAIDEAWGSFGGGIGEGPGADVDEVDPLGRWHEAGRREQRAETQVGRLVAQGTAIGDEPALHFLHVVSPHVPWFATPWGTSILRPVPAWRDDPSHPGSRWSAQVRYQRHSLQTGATDEALGRVLDHLHERGLWDDTTLVVTADHGTSTIWPDVRREPTSRNREEVYRVPFFLKVPGQDSPEVVDVPALTIDVLPTLADVLDIELDWDMDGHSLLDGSDPVVGPLVSRDVAALLDVVRRHEADFPHGSDWTGLAAVGAHGALVGTSVARLEVGAPSGLSWQPAHDASFASLPTPEGRVPWFLTGTITSPDGGEPPPPLVVEVNGTVAGVTGGYERAGGRAWTFSALVGPFWVDGVNEVVAHEVVPGPDGPVLRPLR